MTLKSWLCGLFFSIVLGAICSWLFLKLLRKLLKLPESSGKKVPPLITGIFERIFFSILVAYQFSDVTSAMMAWLALKMASNWNRRELNPKRHINAYRLSALLAGLVSMLFAAIGGLIILGRINF